MPAFWYYRRDEQQFGPVSEAELVRLAADGGLDPDDLVWSEGMANWERAATVPSLRFPEPDPEPPRRDRIVTRREPDPPASRSRGRFEDSYSAGDDPDDERPSRRRRARGRYRDDEDEDDYPRGRRRPFRRASSDPGGGFAIAALACGLVGLLISCLCWPIGAPCAVLAIIFGILGLKSTNRGMALAGIILGGVTVVVMVGMIVFAVTMQVVKP